MMEQDLKVRLLELSLHMFQADGIKHVTMDAIANEAGISKRTLYEMFKDKDDLLMQCLYFDEIIARQNHKKILKEASNVMEIILLHYQSALEHLRKLNPYYLSDIYKYHPVVAAYFENHKINRETDVALFLEKGKIDGYIREDVNVVIISSLLSEQFQILFNRNTEMTKQFTFWEIFQTIVMNFVRGIATAKGTEVIDNFLLGSKIKNQYIN